MTLPTIIVLFENFVTVKKTESISTISTHVNIWENHNDCHKFSLYNSDCTGMYKFK